MDLTVAICAYNAAQRIGMVLESLAEQQIQNGLRWELLVIDNASTDGTGEVAQSWFARIGAPYRVIREPIPGLANARRCASLEARGRWLSFLDDDTIARSDWVSSCASFLSRHPQTGIVGGRVLPRFQNPAAVTVDVWKTHRGLLSLYDQGDQEMRVNGKDAPLPVGAGMSGPTECFIQVFDRIGSLTVGRTGGSLRGGEDLEAMLLLKRLGWEIWYCPAMELHHWIPQKKLESEYYDRWLVDTAVCNAWLSILAGREAFGGIASLAWRGLVGECRALRQLALAPVSRPKKKTRFYWSRLSRSHARGYWEVLRHYRRALSALKATSLSQVSANSPSQASS